MIKTMERLGAYEEFSLLGGPFQRFFSHVGLVRDRTNTVFLGLVIGACLWTVLLLLAVTEGITEQFFSLSVIGGHVRLLFVIPLFFVCETLIDPRMTSFIVTLVRSGVIPAAELPVLDRELSRIRRWKDSWLPDVLCLIAAVAFSWLAPLLYLPGTTTTYDPAFITTELTMARQWYLIVCLTIFRFLIARWIWRLGLWCFLLWRVAKLEMTLVPTHPDGAAGLGYLEVVHAHFLPLVLAISVLQAAMFAEDISAGLMTLEGVYPSLVLILVVDAVLFIGPMFIFSHKLWACRVKGLSDYMEFAERYVSDFDNKWLKAEVAPDEPLLGSQDIQGLADLRSSFGSLRQIRWVPVSMRLLMSMAAAALLPMLPLLLLKYPVSELAEKFFTNLAGF